MTKFNNKHRYLAQITIEAKTPLQIGNGAKNIMTDSPVVRDVNDLPFIPGTSLAGLIAHALGGKKKEIMGSQKEGSRLIVTEAKLLGKDGKPIDGLVDFSKLNKDNQDFLNLYKRLTIRQHVRISHRGVAEDKGKFDEEIVIKGSRFCFEMELISKEDKNKKDNFNRLLEIIQSPVFRIGSGSRSGFGVIEVVKCRECVLDLEKEEDRKLYMEKSSLMSEDWRGWMPANDKIQKKDFCEGWTSYRLELTPNDFVLFGSGFGNENADMTYVRENYITWNEEGTEAEVKQGTKQGVKQETEQEKMVLIPGSSVKGALSHRTAFHYNRLKEVFAEDLTPEKAKQHVGVNNTAVLNIFGSEGEKDEDTGKMKKKKRGNILISDVIEERESVRPKVLNHVSIDRFTGGAIEGALFNEETLYAKGESFIIDIMIADEAFIKDNVQPAFESALKDVAAGLLPLGGGVNRGNGVFTGKATKYNKETKQWEELA